MINNYARAYTEVLEILSYFSNEEYSKIPEEKIKYFKENMDKDYIYTINPEIDLSVQHISSEANAILISLFRDYFASENQKGMLSKLLNKNQEKVDKAKREKYNTDDIFNKEKAETVDNNIENMELQIIEYKESFYSKFTKFIKRLLGHATIK